MITNAIIQPTKFYMLKTVAIFHPGTLGDSVLAIPCFKAIRRNLGEGAKLIMIHETFPGLVKPKEVLSGTGLIDEYMDYPHETKLLRKLLAALQFLFRVRMKGIDAVIYLVPVKRDEYSVKRDHFFFGLCGIPHRIGFTFFPEQEWVKRNSDGYPVAVKHEIEWKLHRMETGGIDISAEMHLLKQPFFKVPAPYQEEAYRWLGRVRKAPGKKLIGLCVGTGMPSKAWPCEYFKQLVDRLLERGDCEILLLGGKAEQSVALDIINSVPDVLNAVGIFPVLVSAGLVSLCNLYIGLDTGLTHMAAVIGIKTIGIYSMTNPLGSYTPLGDRVVIFTNPVHCGGCWHKFCPEPDHPCMKGITVKTIVDEAFKSLDG